MRFFSPLQFIIQNSTGSLPVGWLCQKLKFLLIALLNVPLSRRSDCNSYVYIKPFICKHLCVFNANFQHKNLYILSALIVLTNFLTLPANAMPAKAVSDEMTHFKTLNRTEYIFPKENQVVFNCNLTLQWRSNASVSHQRLQISFSKNFDHSIIDTVLSGQSFILEKLEKNKEYYWRILMVVPDMNKPIYSDFSFFKTTSLQLQEPDQTLRLNLIPTYAGEQQVLYIDNPYHIHYVVEVKNARDNTMIFNRQSFSSSECIPTYKFPKGKYILTFQFSEDAKQRTQEILLTQTE